MPEAPRQADVPSAAEQASAALNVFVRTMGGLEEADPESATTTFYDRLCEAVCGTIQVDRAVLFLYDEGRRRVRAVGTHRIDKSRFPSEGVGIEDAPLSRVALEEDRVVDGLEQGTADEVRHPDLAMLPEGDLAYVPVVAGGVWSGVLIVEQSTGMPLGRAERDALYIAGKVVALATVARRATRHQEQARQLRHHLALARAVHDEVIQRLFGVGLVLASDEPLDGEVRRRMREEVEAAQADLRQMLHGPRLTVAIPTRMTLAEEAERLRRAHDGVDLHLDLEDGIAVPAAHEPLAQSVLGEAVQNARKHAGSERLDVSLRRIDDTVALTVDSHGRQDGRSPSGGTGLGLRLAAVEALQAGGLLEFGPQGEHGWRVRLLLPIDDDAEER
ncbi:MAG: GAF domain-containing protein [Solirubrobacteraceae bacterium]|nr:GAF domain-containing protein [Solirubrobacteraceae bacterium]